MVVYSIRCSNCEETRVGPERGDDIEPYRNACPECGETDYTVPGKE